MRFGDIGGDFITRPLFESQSLSQRTVTHDGQEMKEETIFPTTDQASSEVDSRYENPRNYGPMSSCDGHAQITGPCGDTMELWLKIDGDRIAKSSFTTTGCGPSRASGSMATELAVGKTLDAVASIDQAAILKALGGLPEESRHCALLAANTLAAAAEGYRSREKQTETAKCDSCTSTVCGAKEQLADETFEEFMERQELAQRMCRIGHKLLVMSGKGGVGKSTVAVNLAMSLAMDGNRVGLLDVDLHGPSIPQLLGVQSHRVSVEDGMIHPVSISENFKMMSIGLLVDNPSDAVIWRGPRKYGVIRQFLSDVAWGPLDYLVVDAPPGTGDEPLAVAQLVGESSGAILVSTPQELAVADVRRSVTFCREIGLPIVGIVENMSGLACPHCGESVELFGSGGGESLADSMDTSFLGRIPIDPEIIRCGDKGTPYMHVFAHSRAAKCLSEIVEQIHMNLESLDL